jgi:phosphogluconate dehydratase
VRDGDVIRLDARAGTLQVLVNSADWEQRLAQPMPEALAAASGLGMGRELFAGLRRNALTAEQGACSSP